MTISVFLLDDHEIVRRGVRDLLEAAGDLEVVGEAGSAEEALQQLRDGMAVDIVVLEVPERVYSIFDGGDACSPSTTTIAGRGAMKPFCRIGAEQSKSGVGEGAFGRDGPLGRG